MDMGFFNAVVIISKSPCMSKLYSSHCQWKSNPDQSLLRLQEPAVERGELLDLNSKWTALLQSRQILAKQCQLQVQQ